MERQDATLFNKSFVGQKLSICPAILDDIDQDKITAFAHYGLDYKVDEFGRHYNYKKNELQNYHIRISYEILYDKANFYNQLKPIYPKEMVKFGGIIKNIKIDKTISGHHVSLGNYELSIELSLTSIKKTENRFLHAE